MVKLSATGQYSALIAAMLMLCLILASCSVGPGASKEADVVSNFPAHQIYKEKILEDFEANLGQAKRKYVEEWVMGKAQRDRDNSTQAVVAWLSIAGALIKVDSVHYDEYYSFIISNIESRDWEVASSAVTALSGARGTESIDLIVMLIRDPRGLVSADAVSAIQYRINTAIYDPALRSDYDYAISKIKSVCQAALNVRGLDLLCRENELIL